MVTRMIIQTTRLHPSRSDQIEGAPILTSENPSPSDAFDWEVPPRNRRSSVRTDLGLQNRRSEYVYSDSVARPCLVDHPLRVTRPGKARPRYRHVVCRPPPGGAGRPHCRRGSSLFARAAQWGASLGGTVTSGPRGAAATGRNRHRR